MESVKPPRSETLHWVLSTLGCPELDVQGAADLAQRFGFPAMELRTLEGRVDLAAYLEEKYVKPERFAGVVRSAGVAVPVVDSSFGLLSHRPEEREELLRLVPWVEELGCRKLRVFDGGSYQPSLSQKDMDAFQRASDWWDNERARWGFRCDWVVETHGCLCHPQSLLDLQARLQRPLAILWDTHHTWHGSDWGVAQTWAALRSWVAHTHVKDSVRAPEQRPPYVLTLPGQGDFPLLELFDQLALEPTQPGVTFEWEWHWNRSLPPIEEALACLCALEGSGPRPS